MKNKIQWSIILFTILYSCTPGIEDLENSNLDPSNDDPVGESIYDLIIPSNFNFETSSKALLDVEVQNLESIALPWTKVSVFTDHPDFGGRHLTSGFTDFNGRLLTEIQFPSYLDEVFVQVHTIGFANQKSVSITPHISVQFGGQTSRRNFQNSSKTNSDPIAISGNYYYMGTFNQGSSQGLPHYLEPEGDVLSQEFLDGVNASLPENKPVPTNNPQYLTTGNELDIIVNDRSDIWVTFVTEGAGYRNTLGYYVFDTNDPPATANEIDSIFVVLPNASFSYSGGELNAGDKVKLGTFDSGQTISWVLFQNAWNGTGVNVNATKFYSRNEFNTSESDPNQMQHTVQLADFGRQLLLNGFEDQTRSAGSDNDFNDLVFYVTANPWEAIEIGGIPVVTPDTDSDDDGISDESDDFPSDPLRAIRNTYIGTLAFEDLWPSRGDYDFNDLVIDYEVDHILNGNNLLVEIECDWTIKAAIAGYSNGFGVQLNELPTNAVASITGSHLTESIVTLNGNGTEANQQNTTMVVFDNIFSAVAASGSSYPHTSPVTTISNTVTMSNPISQSIVGFPPYNAFIFANGDREVEIHLSGHEPTNLANEQLFGTFADATNFETNYLYKTSNGLPWAIHISEPFDFPKEGIPIHDAYLNFAIWATSGGTSNTDWHLNIPGNRNESLIYD
jgi:LruC domain-containing protein